jgi:hypothetical protein
MSCASSPATAPGPGSRDADEVVIEGITPEIVGGRLLGYGV